MTRRKDMSLLLTAVMLFLAFDFGNCNTQQIEKIRSKVVNLVENAHSVGDREARSVRRFRRSALTGAEMKEALDTHNAVRRMEGASNMELMTWNSDIANISDIWANKCIWNHSRYPNLGENLYEISNSFTISLTDAIMAWYNEKENYTYATLTCNAQMCGHYTQVVWATSRELGCAYVFCPTMQQSTYINATYLVCNYRPAGNVEKMKPFNRGTPCSNCETRSWWCNNGLCDRSCTTTSQTCECRQVCRNNATSNSDSCSCSCKDGWYGSDCSVVCQDYDSMCNPTSGYKYDPASCTDETYRFFIREKCPATCKQCQVVPSSTKPLLLSMPTVWLSWLLLCAFRRI